MSESRKPKPDENAALLARVRAAARQEQFLEVVSAEEARARFEKHLDLKPLAGETRAARRRARRACWRTMSSPRSMRRRSTAPMWTASRCAPPIPPAPATAAPKIFRLNAEVIACGDAPALEVAPGTATTIATGGVIPRGADAVVMIEQTELIGEGAPAIELRRAAAPGQFISYAGSDIARGETLLRRGTRIGSREIGMLAACGLGDSRRGAAAESGGALDRRRTGGARRAAASPRASTTATARSSRRRSAEAGGEPLCHAAPFPTTRRRWKRPCARALAQSDMVVLSGGTSKGAGDLSHRVVSRLGKPGILVHGVALKPGKPLCLGVIGDKPVVVLPGFPTSAIFTFHAFVAPVIRARAGLPPEAARNIERARAGAHRLRTRPQGIRAGVADRERGRPGGVSDRQGLRLGDELLAGRRFPRRSTRWPRRSMPAASCDVTLIGSAARAPDLVIMGSHDVALDVVVGALAERGFSARTLAVGSLGGVAAAQPRRMRHRAGASDRSGERQYNVHLAAPGLRLVRGWQRMQGILFRPGDKRFEGRSAQAALKAALADSAALMVNRNAGAGTRVLIDKLLAGARPPGYANQPKSHNAVAAAIAQERADWGVAIEPVAKLYGLGFLPLSPEHYDFLLVESRTERPAVQAFLAACANPRRARASRRSG